jgi:hypothetical protein
MFKFSNSSFCLFKSTTEPFSCILNFHLFGLYLVLLTALVWSVIRRLPNSCPVWKNPWQDHGYKWSLLKIRERKYKGNTVSPRWKPKAKRVCFCNSVFLEPTITYGKGRTRRFPPNNSPMTGEGHGCFPAR